MAQTPRRRLQTSGVDAAQDEVMLKAAGHEAVVAIPDYCVFGAVASVTDLPGFLRDPFGKLALTGS